MSILQKALNRLISSSITISSQLLIELERTFYFHNETLKQQQQQRTKTTKTTLNNKNFYVYHHCKPKILLQSYINNTMVLTYQQAGLSIKRK